MRLPLLAFSVNLFASPFLPMVAHADGAPPTAVASAENPPSLDASTSAATAPPPPHAEPTTHMHSPGMLAGGVTLLVIGTGATAAGAALFARTGCTPPGETSGCVSFDPLPEVLLPVGISSLIVGGLLTFVGAQRDPVAPTVSVTLGLRSIVLFGTF